MNPLFTQQTRITYYDLDCNGKVKLSALLRMVHVAADVNASELGASYNVLHPLGMTFVLQRFGVNVIRMPAYNEDITIRTWPYGIDKGTFLRQGDMYDAKGEKIMEWASMWLLFDINARRPLRPAALPVPLLTLEDENVTVKPDKILVPADFGQHFYSYNHIVTYRDVDTNMHMNNSIYGDLIGDALFPITRLTAGLEPVLKQVQINYLAEMRLGAEVEVTAHRDRDCFIITGESGGRRAFAAQVRLTSH